MNPFHPRTVLGFIWSACLMRGILLICEFAFTGDAVPQPWLLTASMAIAAMLYIAERVE